MAGDTMRFRNPAGHAGLLHNLLALLNSVAGFLETRLALFGKESKTALVHVLVLVDLDHAGCGGTSFHPGAGVPVDRPQPDETIDV